MSSSSGQSFGSIMAGSRRKHVSNRRWFIVVGLSWLQVATNLVLVRLVACEQEQLEQIVHERLQCERVDGGIGNPVVLCDCQRHVASGSRPLFDESKKAQPAFTLPPFAANTVPQHTDIVIGNCAQLHVPTGTFRAIRSGFLPRTVLFQNVDQLTLESFAFETARAAQQPDPRDPHPNLGPIQLSFNRCHVEELPANVFHGASLRTIHFTACTIGSFRSSAIGVRLQRLTLQDTEIGHFGRHSFKRAQLEELRLSNVTMHDPWPSQAWQGIVVSELIQISDSTFLQAVHPAAIVDSQTNELLLQNNVFKQSIADEAFQLAVTWRVSLVRNVFGQVSSNLLRGLVISNDTQWNTQPNIVIEGNRIDTFVPSSSVDTFFTLPRNFSFAVQSLRIAELATCETTNVGASFAVWQEIFFLRPFSVTSRDDQESYISVEKFRQQENCDSTGPDMVLIIVLSTLLAITLLGGLIGGLLCYRRQQKRQRMLLLEQKLVQPRTYRETQVVLKLETVGVLKTDF